MKMLILAALVAATTPLVPATAETVPVSATVATHDLDLTDARDRRRLDLRLARAAQSVCGEPSDFDVVGHRKAAECRRDVIGRFIPVRDAMIARAGEVSLAAR
jgi:UrcA family protein